MIELSLHSGSILRVQETLYEFVRDEVLEGTEWTSDEVFRMLGQIVEGFGPNNQQLLATRQAYQDKIDT